MRTSARVSQDIQAKIAIITSKNVIEACVRMVRHAQMISMLMPALAYLVIMAQTVKSTQPSAIAARA